MIDFLTQPDLTIWEIIVLAVTAAAFSAFIYQLVSYYYQAFKVRSGIRLLEEKLKNYPPEVIKSSLRYYVQADCSSTDPHQEEHQNLTTAEHNLFKAVNKHLWEEQPHHHLLILAGPGMGKTSFLLNYYLFNQRLPSLQRQKIEIIPLSLPDADERIKQVEDQENTVIFLDAFNEDRKAARDHRKRLVDLIQACGGFKRVLITCRTGFFEKGEEITEQTGRVKIGPFGFGEEYEFRKFYLSLLRDKKIEEYLKRRYPFWMFSKRNKVKKIVPKMPDFSQRPILLGSFPNLVGTGEEIRYQYQIYRFMMEKELEKTRDRTDKEASAVFFQSVALDIFLNSEKRGSEYIPRQKLSSLAEEKGVAAGLGKPGIPFLSIDDGGNGRFVHRSMMEYLFVIGFLGLPDSKRSMIVWTKLMKRFLVEMIFNNRDNREFFDSLSSVDLSGVELKEANLRRANLNGARLRQANLERANLVTARLEGAILDKADLSGASLDEAYLKGACLREANLREADLEAAHLDEADFYGADLDKADLKRASLRGANLKGVNLKETNLEGVHLEEANLEGAILHGSSLRGTFNLRNTRLIGVKGLSKEALELAGSRGAIVKEGK